MATHLGRNPFSKRSAPTVPPSQKTRDSDRKQENPSEKSLGELLLVDLPTESFMFVLKAALFMKGVLNKK